VQKSLAKSVGRDIIPVSNGVFGRLEGQDTHEKDRGVIEYGVNNRSQNGLVCG
jgi:hypothetical protein